MPNHPDAKDMDRRHLGLILAREALDEVANNPPAEALSKDERAACLVEHSKLVALVETIGTQLARKGG